MLAMTVARPDVIDVPTLVFVAAVVSGFLGILLIATWMQQREVRALAWWGSAYLIGASAIALWGAPSPMLRVPSQWAEALFIVACGMVWNGVRLFRGRRLVPQAAFGGAVVWLILCQLPVFAPKTGYRLWLGAVIVAVYTLFIAFELARERRKIYRSRAAVVIVPLFYAGVFFVPLALRAFAPALFPDRWITVFAFESIIYAVGTAFIVLMMVKDNHVQFYRTAATTDALTGLLNRGAFLDAARQMQTAQGARGEPVTLIMLDLDHFKSVNDRFGHAIGDDVLRLFAKTAQGSVRATDLIGRLGGEEFVAMVPAAMEDACNVAERLRAAFETAGQMVGNVAIGATVSSGLATSYKPEPDIDALLLRADEALYAAKRDGRNRFHCAPEEPGSEEARARIAARTVAARQRKRRFAARRPQVVAG